MSEVVEFELGVKQAAAIFLFVGVLVGFSGGLAFSSFNSGPLAMASSDSADTQESQGVSADMTPEETFRQISDDMGLDTESLMQCYSNSDNSEAVTDRNNIVSEVGGIGTPTFFVGNRDVGFVRVTGAQPFSRFQEAIDTVRSEDRNESKIVRLDNVELTGEPSKGDEDAPIKILEYTDYGCPFCSEWNGFDASNRIPIDRMKVAQQVDSEYVETGEVQFIMKDYPVPQLHPNGPKAHKAANCVFEQDEDRYWEFHDELFKNRDSWMQG